MTKKRLGTSFKFLDDKLTPVVIRGGSCFMLQSVIVVDKMYRHTHVRLHGLTGPCECCSAVVPKVGVGTLRVVMKH